MAPFKNQKQILIKLDKILHHKNDGHDFLMSINWDAIDLMHSILSSSEFEIYIYFYRWAGTEEKGGYFLSPANIYYDTSISESTVHRAIKRFEELKILVKEKNNKYIFDPLPEHLIEIEKVKRAERILKKQ